MIPPPSGRQFKERNLTILIRSSPGYLRIFIQNFDIRPKENSLSFQHHTGEMTIQGLPGALVSQLCTKALWKPAANSQGCGEVFLNWQGGKESNICQRPCKLLAQVVCSFNIRLYCIPYNKAKS